MEDKKEKLWEMYVGTGFYDSHMIIQASTREEAIGKGLHAADVSFNLSEVEDLNEFLKQEDIDIEQVEFGSEGVWVYDEGT